MLLVAKEREVGANECKSWLERESRRETEGGNERETWRGGLLGTFYTAARSSSLFHLAGGD